MSFRLVKNWHGCCCSVVASVGITFRLGGTNTFNILTTGILQCSVEMEKFFMKTVTIKRKPFLSETLIRKDNLLTFLKHRQLKTVVNILGNLSLIFFGCVICAAAVNGILVPKKFLAGGATGLAMLLHYVWPVIPVGFVYFFLNIPLFVVGWMFVGRRFFFYSLAGTAIFSWVMLWPYPVFPIEDMILNALTSGIIMGVGSGIILRSLGSAGGLDILSVILFKKFSLRPGNTVLAFNVILLTSSLFYVQMEMVLYTLIHLYVGSHFVNFVVTGLSQRKALTIISTSWQEISDNIKNRLDRGVTIVKGEGGYTGRDIKILYTVVTIRELPRFKEMIRGIDPNAFVVVTDTLEVMGNRVGNQPHW